MLKWNCAWQGCIASCDGGVKTRTRMCVDTYIHAYVHTYAHSLTQTHICLLYVAVDSYWKQWAVGGAALQHAAVVCTDVHMYVHIH
jgi:hypothetical protein